MDDSKQEDLIIIKASFPTVDKPIMEASVEELMDYLVQWSFYLR